MTERPSDGDVDRYVAALDHKSVPRFVREERGTDGPPLEKGESRYLVTAQTLPHRGGSILEVTGPSIAALDTLQVGGKTYEATDIDYSPRPLLLEVTTEIGVGRSPHTDAAYRGDLTARLGYGWASGGDKSRIEPRRRLLVFAGIGGGYDGAAYVRPEVGVTVDSQDVVTPLRQPIAQSLRKSISLSFAMPKGEGFVAYEGGVALAVPPYGGLFARIGYEVGDQGKGMTYFAGAQLGSKPTIAIGALIGLGYLIYYAAMNIDINTCSEKNGPCE